MGFNVPFVNGNIPYLNVTNVTVGTQAVADVRHHRA